MVLIALGGVFVQDVTSPLDFHNVYSRALLLQGFTAGAVNSAIWV